LQPAFEHAHIYTGAASRWHFNTRPKESQSDDIVVIVGVCLCLIELRIAAISRTLVEGLRRGEGAKERRRTGWSGFLKHFKERGLSGVR